MSDINELQKAREIINDVDKQIAVLFEKRMNAAKLVADYKKKNGLPVEDLEREKALVEKMLPLIENEELKSYYIGFMNNTMEVSKAYQRRLLDGMKVAFSGVKGAFADIAVKRIFPYAERVAYKNFKSAYKEVENGECDCSVLTIENSY
ncbi:MAG: chorismate mutase [Clostridia bacterium]|nr:chorismate mutase [Clostridia bacterium]